MKNLTIDENNNTIYIVISTIRTGENAIIGIFADLNKALDECDYYNQETDLKTKVIEKTINLRRN